MKSVEEMAEEHWKYVEKVLLTHGEDEDVIEKIKFHYISSFLHGVKHGKNNEK